MKKNYSPWLYQLKKDRASKKLESDITTDVAIIGAGIAGISTAFYILKNTNKKIVILERFKLAHGATGHNAGQVVSYFERGFASLVDEFGLDKATHGQKAVEDAWELLEEMYTEANLNIPFSRFLGHAGLSNFEQVLLHLKNNDLRSRGGLHTERLIISETADFLGKIPAEYHDLYTTAPQEKILEILETKVSDFIAVLSYQKGCINSALFCEEILLYLLQKYSDRLNFFEHTPVHKIILRHADALLDAEKHTITTENVILCTNGFTGVSIFNETGLDINTKFHELVHGTVGYMSGYLEKMNKPPTAISYLNGPTSSTEEPYFYLTRRMYEYEQEKDFNLISIGGPEVALDDSRLYSQDTDFPDEEAEKIDEFVMKSYETDPNREIDYVFTWHGLMGYTKNGIRLIGPEPKNNVLMYNLGCNGIGILPSIYGGKQLGEMIAGNIVVPSIFDIPKEYH